jgi:hypothetical protein
MTEKEQVGRVAGDGGPGQMSEPMLAKLKDEVEAINSDLKRYIWKGRLASEDARLARWSGQSADGLLHEDDLGEEPEPFEGATDSRIRWADQVVNEEVALRIVTALRARVRFDPVGAEDAARAGMATIVMDWVMRHMLGIRWIRELTRLAQYECGDSPGLALMKAWWRREQSVKLQKATAADLMAAYLEQYAGALQESGETDSEAMMESARAAAMDFLALAQDPEQGEEILEDTLLKFFPGITAGRAKSAARELKRRGQTEFPIPRVSFEGEDVAALRLFEDFFIPVNMRDWEECQLWFEVEWVGEPTLRARIHEQGYARRWVEELLKKGDGIAVFPDYVRDNQGRLVARGRDYYRGLYQIVTAHFVASNADDVPGRYYVVFHPDILFPAHGRRLEDRPHGGWPGHLFVRELISSRPMDSRGIPELLSPWQGTQKVLADSIGNNAQVGALPPVVTYGRRGAGDLRIRPLGELEAQRDGQYKWFPPPPYPQTTAEFMKYLQRQVDEYFGRPVEGSSKDLVRTSMQFRLLWWMANVREVLRLIWADVSAYMPAEMLGRITDPQGAPLELRPEDIQGEFDITLEFEPQDADPEYLKIVGTIVKDVLLAMDRDKAIETTPIVDWLLWRLSPQMARRALRPVARAQADEIEDEVQALLKIRAGMEPELADDGSVNYELRAQFYEGLQRLNPAAFSDMSEDKKKILASRLERMQVLAGQYGENRQIGREGGRRALPEKG